MLETTHQSHPSSSPVAVPVQTSPGGANSDSPMVIAARMTYAGPKANTPPEFKTFTPPANSVLHRSVTPSDDECSTSPIQLIPPGADMSLQPMASQKVSVKMEDSPDLGLDQEWTASDVFQDVIDSFEDDDLRLKHHLAHRATLSTLFLGASGGVRWLGLSAIEEMFQGFHIPPSAANPLAIATTAMSFLTTNLLGVYAVNHMPFEGVSQRWQLLSGVVALVPSVIDSIAGYVALSTLGLGAPVAMGGAGISFLGNIFYYWNFVDRLPFILKGQNDVKELLAERAQWLQDDIEKELQKPEIQAIKNKATLCKTLAERLIRPRFGECIQRLLPIASQSHRNRNIIAEIKAAKSTPKLPHTLVSQLKWDAIQSRTSGCNKAGKLALLGVFSSACCGFTWSDNSPSINSLIGKFYPTMVCASAAQTAYYAACHGCAQLFSVAETISTGVLSFDNARALHKSLKDGLRNTWRKASKSDVAMFTLGIGASLCYTLTIYGAVRKDLEEDPCLGNQQPASYLLPIMGAAAGFLHTWMIGPELRGVKNAVKDLCINVYRSCKAQLGRSEPQGPTEVTPLLQEQGSKRSKPLEEKTEDETEDGYEDVLYTSSLEEAPTTMVEASVEA